MWKAKKPQTTANSSFQRSAYFVPFFVPFFALHKKILGCGSERFILSFNFSTLEFSEPFFFPFSHSLSLFSFLPVPFSFRAWHDCCSNRERTMTDSDVWGIRVPPEDPLLQQLLLFYDRAAEETTTLQDQVETELTISSFFDHNGIHTHPSPLRSRFVLTHTFLFYICTSLSLHLSLSLPLSPISLSPCLCLPINPFSSDGLKTRSVSHEPTTASDCSERRTFVFWNQRWICCRLLIRLWTLRDHGFVIGSPTPWIFLADYHLLITLTPLPLPPTLLKILPSQRIENRHHVYHLRDRSRFWMKMKTNRKWSRTQFWETSPTSSSIVAGIRDQEALQEAQDK